MNTRCGLSFIFAAIISLAFTDIAFAQMNQRSSGFSRSSASASANASSGPIQGRGSSSMSPRDSNSSDGLRTSATSTRSIAFNKNGKQVSIKEDQAGISVSINDKTVRAKDTADLKKRFPDAYKLYKTHMNSAHANGSSRAGGFANGGGSSSTVTLPQSGNKGSRSISFSENGKKISITKNKRGITVTANGKTIRAKSVSELEEKHPEAFRLYDKHFTRIANISPGDQGEPNMAKQVLRAELNRLIEDESNDPTSRGMFQKMLQDLN